VTASNGLTVQVSPGSLKLVAGFPNTAAVTVFASASATPGNFTVTVTSKSGSVFDSQQLAVRVLNNLVYMQKFAFSPVSLTVKSGTTVYFYNADPPHTWCGVSDSGAKSIMFTTVVSTTSPVMQSFSIWSLTFTQPGTYSYFDSMHATGGNGTIIVSG
jgi:plastocyanin